MAVLGAGIQGVCTGLEIARRGLEVDLFDQDAKPLQRASLVNEGKIHLGFVYAKDPSLRTARLMLEGALHFKSLLRRFVPEGAFRTCRPFDYLVASDSMVPAHAVSRHFDKVEEIYNRYRCDRPDVDYLGGRPDALFRPLPLADMDGLTEPGRVVAAYRTQELAIEPASIAEALTSALDHSNRVRFHGQHHVESLARSACQYTVQGRSPSGPWSRRYDQVVNALWSGRLAIDASLGVALPKRWNYRLKLCVSCQMDWFEFADRSYTMMLGPYGDIVQLADGSTFVSWYPACLSGWSTDLAPPAAWERICSGRLDRDERTALARSILAAAAREWIPALAEARPIGLAGGIICGAGESDIDTQDSDLHHRYEAGVYSSAGYHSINTGKYTLAPLFASQAAERVMRAARFGTQGDDAG